MEEQAQDLLSHLNQSKKKKCMKQLCSRHWTLGSQDYESLRDRKQMRWVLQLPHLTTLREFLDSSTGRENLGRTGILLELRRCCWESRKPRQLEFTEQSARKQRAPQRENPEDLHQYLRPPSNIQQSTDWCICVRKPPKARRLTIQKDFQWDWNPT